MLESEDVDVPESSDKVQDERRSPVNAAPAGAERGSHAPRPQALPEEPRTTTPPTATESFRPILSEQVLRRFTALSSRPRPNLRVALVLVSTKGTPRLFKPRERPTVGELVWGGSGTLYEVDMGLHDTTIEFDLPSHGDTFAFHAVVMVQWRVAEPIRIVEDAVHDVRQTLAPPLQQQLGDVTRGFYPRAVANAEAAARSRLGVRDIGRDYGLQTTVFLRLTMNPTAVSQLTSLEDVSHRIELEKRTQELRVLQEQNNEILLGARVRRYREMISAGDVNQFALQLAQNPADVPNVVQLIREERHENRRHATDFVTRLLDSGVIEKWEIDDQARAALELLKESTQRVIRPPDQPTGPQQPGNGALPSPELVSAPLPDSPSSSIAPPPDPAS